MQRLPIAKFARVRTLPHISHIMTKKKAARHNTRSTTAADADNPIPPSPPLEATLSQESQETEYSEVDTATEMADTFRPLFADMAASLKESLMDATNQNHEAMQSDQYTYHKEMSASLEASIGKGLAAGFATLGETFERAFGSQRQSFSSSSPEGPKNEGPKNDDDSFHSSEHGGLDSNRSRPPPYGDSRYSLATKTIDATKFAKALQQVNPITSDTVSMIRNFYDETVTALSSVTGIPQPLPEYTALSPTTDFESLLVPPVGHQLHDAAKSQYRSLALTLRTHLLGERVITKTAARLHLSLVTNAQLQCGFSLLKAIVFDVSPQLGGRNQDLIALIERFSPEDGEEVNTYFSRGQSLFNEAVLQGLPSSTKNRLIEKWLSGLARDERYSSRLSQALTAIRRHNKGPTKDQLYPRTLNKFYLEFYVDCDAPEHIRLSGTDITSQIDARFASMFALQDAPSPAFNQTSFSHPPRRQDRHGPSTMPSRESTGRSSIPVCECCGLRHGYGAQWCNKRGPEFIRDATTRQRVMQYNAQHGTTNPLLQELIKDQATQPGVPQQATIPKPLRPHARFATHVTEIPSVPPLDDTPFDERTMGPDTAATRLDTQPVFNSMANMTLDDVDDPSTHFFDDLEPPSEYGYNCSFRGHTLPASSSFTSDPPAPSLDTRLSPTIDQFSPNRALLIERTRNKIMRLQRMAANTSPDRLHVVRSVPAQVDGGANANIFTRRTDFLWYQPHRSLVTLANGSKDWSQGYGCVLVRFSGTSTIMPLYPSYLLPGNDWATISPPAIRVYNGARRATVHSLESLEIVDANGNTLIIPTRRDERRQMHLDFVTVDVVKLISSDVSCIPCPDISPHNAAVVTRSRGKRLAKDEPPSFPSGDTKTLDDTIGRSSFSADVCTELSKAPLSLSSDDPGLELSNAPLPLSSDESPIASNTVSCDKSSPSNGSNQVQSDDLARQVESRNRRRTQALLFHQRMAHVPFATLQEMARRQLLVGLPRQLLAPDTPCIICLQAKARTLPHGHTVPTEHLRPGQRLHMDFSFVNVISYRGFGSFLSTICAKTRKLFVIATRSKRPPLELCRYLYMILSRVNRQPHEIRVDRGGELAKSSEFVEFWFNLGVVVNDTGGHASFLNGKVERPNQTIMAGVRALLITKNAPLTNWCEALSYYNQIYDMTLHRAIDDTPYHAWFGVLPSIENLRVWGATVYPITPDRKKLDNRVGDGDFLGFNASSRLVRYRDTNTKTVKISSSAYFDEYNVRDQNGDLTPGSQQLLGQLKDLSTPPPVLALTDSPLMDRPILNIQVVLPAGTDPLGLRLDFDKLAYLPYIVAIHSTSPLYQQFPARHRHEVYILSIDGQKSHDFRSTQRRGFQWAPVCSRR